MSAVSLKNVCKQYGKVKAVSGISMDIAKGEFIAFLGPSGCGKSSTLRMIAGLEEITEGDILFDGASVIDKKPSDRNVSMAFENYALYPTLTVYENLAFPLRSAGKKGFEVDGRVREVAEIMCITELLEKKPSNLSGGQAQAVGLARALIRKPNILLLDEPISHLDTSQRFHMRMYIKRLHIELGYTMILVTHDQEDSMSLADRVAVMCEGKINQIASTREIYDHPADLFVASFIGDLPMNFVDGKVEKKNEKAYFKYLNLGIELPDGFIKQSFPNEVVLGIRPYHLKVHPAQSGEGSIPAEVFVTESLGDLNVVTVQIMDARLQVAMPTSYKAKPNTPVSVSIDKSRILLFDKSTGKAISTL
ncbi:sn-glycerol-3-phosphate import ATP-binding protein UgpC [subsurface metagenome]